MSRVYLLSLWVGVVAAALGGGCASSRQAQPQPVAANTLQRLPPVEAVERAPELPAAPKAEPSAVAQASFSQVAPAPPQPPPDLPEESALPPPEAPRLLGQAEVLAGPPTAPVLDGPPSLPLDLPTALGLTQAQNPRIAFTQAQIAQAYAQNRAARAMWLPSLRAGMNYNKHEGRIQEVAGRNIETTRG